MMTKFWINGKPYAVELSSLPADITLNTFIREHAGLTATKFMCQEGGCGVCICVVRGKHPATGAIRTWAVNSCLTLLNTCADWDITTSEGLGSKQNGYHSIQKRLAKMNGTQCGYCSPGFVMNMYALLEAKGSNKLTMEEIENSFGGNICRCTGYRPILDAMKSFAVDSNLEIPAECQDIEDLTTKKCPKTGDLCSGTCKSAKLSLTYNDGCRWYWPQNVADIFNAFAELKSNDKYMLVAGNTAHGVYRRSKDINIFIDVNAIAELTQYSLQKDSLTLGANLSLTEAMNIFQEAAAQSGFEYCQKLWQHFDLIANVPVRNMGTLAGNLAIKHQYIEFPSDVFIVFKALNVQVIIQTGPTEKRSISIAEYMKTSMDKKLVIAFVLKPYPRDNYIFDSYKVMPRAQNAHAYVNAAFLFKIEFPKVVSSSICFGGINPDFVHATDIEAAFKGKNMFDKQVLSQVFYLMQSKLKANVVLPDPTPEYRQKLAYGLLYKFLLANAPNGAVAEKLRSGGELLKRAVSSGKQSFESVAASFPITQPTEKHEGLMQVAGEANYANDVPVMPNQVWGAFVTAKKIGAKVVDIDASAALKIPGVVAFFSAKDIPGKNSMIGVEEFFFPADEQLFLPENEGTVRFYDQPVGVIIADSNALAQEAAEMVTLKYDGGSSQVIATLHDAINSASNDRMNYCVKSLINELKLKEEYDLSSTGTLDLGYQFHFHMEPHSTVAVPFEGGLQIHSATQWMDLVQLIVAQLLNLRNNEVQVKTRRIGGGFGGKATRCNFAACAAALAAYKLNRPVRFVQSLESMMNVLGKRWPFHLNYNFFVKKNGKIVGIKSTFYEDAGYLPNESPLGHTQLLSKNCYEFSDNYKLDGYMVFTDTPTNTPCRAPGSVEGIAMIENIIEHIAFETGLDPVDVRLANLIPGHKMCQLLPQFINSTNYNKRKADIVAFNAENRWRKKGLGLSIMEYHIGYFGHYAATVAVYHGDGSVVISHGGIEMGQGMNTKIAQVVAHDLGIPLNLVRIEGSNTINGANSMVTGGAVGSEQLCFAVRKCCTTLNERLKPVKEALKDPSWQDVINEAHNRQINMIVSDYCKQSDMDPYTICGMSLSELEVDILTGNYIINRVDILEDTGESLNPNVDVGQIESAFIMGMGYWTTEKCVVDPLTGEMKTNRSWNYKPPGAKDIPIDFRIELLPKAGHPAGFMRSKATGEPAITLSISVAFALEHAVQSARNDAGLKKAWVPLTAPMTPEDIVLNAGTDISMLKLQ